MRKPKTPPEEEVSFQAGFANLKRAVDEIEKHPKYSVIHFATAVELILKAQGKWDKIVANFAQ